MTYENSRFLLTRLLKLCTLSYFSSFRNASEGTGILAYLANSLKVGDDGSQAFTETTMFNKEYSDDVNGVHDMMFALFNDGQATVNGDISDEICE